MDEKKDWKASLEMMELRLKVSKSFFVLGTFVFLISYFFVASGFSTDVFIYVLRYSYFMFITSFFLLLFFFFKIYTKNRTFYITLSILILFYILAAMVVLFPKNLFL